MRPTRWRRSTHVVIGVVVLVVVGAVVAVAALVSGGHTTSAGQALPAPTPATVKPAVVPVADDAPVPTPHGMAQALALPVADPNLGAMTGRITDADTGAVLWQQGADIPMQPASTNKTLTSSAALLTMARDARVTTRVVAADQTAQPGVVVLVGGGDPTLSAAPAGQDTWYRDAARISDLADQVRRSGTKVTAVQVDTSFYSGPKLAPGWDPADIDGGDIAPMESVMLDAGRIQPTTVDSGRSLTPALDAGRALAIALNVDPATVTLFSGIQAPSTGKELAAVQSAPLIERLNEMMNDSDNVMAEAIAREVAAATKHPVSFAGAVDAVTARLTAANIDLTGAVLVDSSGLSVDDRLTATTLDEVMGEAAGPDQPKLRPLLDVLPIAGGSGTLSNRFLDPPSERASAGWLRAKTGSLTGTNALAGVVTDTGGRVLTFAFISNNAGPTGRLAIDALAASLRSCGCGS